MNAITLEEAERREGLSTSQRFTISPFKEIRLGCERRYAIKGLIPKPGLIVVYGPPKCGKSYWQTDAALHVALGWKYRGRRVQQGTVVYLALEGVEGFRARLEAFRQQVLADAKIDVPFYLVSGALDLVRDHTALIKEIRAAVVGNAPVLVVIDTLNRSFNGSESADDDMTAYIKAADAIKEAFGAAVVIVHHSGINDSRPRGHTSLTGAADAQIAVKRTDDGTIHAKVEFMKDGPDGEEIASRLEPIDLGDDEDGDPITACVVIAAESNGSSRADPRLTKNQKTMFDILHAATPPGLTWSNWAAQTKESGVGAKRKADLFDIRSALKTKRLIHQMGKTWVAEK